MNKRAKTVDIAERFFKSGKEFSMFVSTFDAICGTDFDTRFPSDEPMDITPALFFAYKELENVWRDVLNHIQDPSYTCMHIEVLETEAYKQHPSDRLINPTLVSKPKCSFKYRNMAFTVKYCDGIGWSVNTRLQGAIKEEL